MSFLKYGEMTNEQCFELGNAITGCNTLKRMTFGLSNNIDNTKLIDNSSDEENKKEDDQRDRALSLDVDINPLLVKGSANGQSCYYEDKENDVLHVPSWLFRLISFSQPLASLSHESPSKSVGQKLPRRQRRAGLLRGCVAGRRVRVDQAVSERVGRRHRLRCLSGVARGRRGGGARG